MEGNFEESQEWIPKYSSFEQESIDIIESLPDSDHELEIEKCNYDRKLWNYFQNCALAIAQLYRGIIHICWFQRLNLIYF